MTMPALADRRVRTRRDHLRDATLRSPTPRPRRAGDAGDFDPYDTLHVRSLNVSRHGVGLLSPEPVRPGTFHRLSIDGDEAEVRVAHCRPEGDGYYVGAAFC